MEEIKTQLNALISGGKIPKAIKILQSLDLKDSKMDEIVTIASRYNRFIEEKNQGTLTHEQATVTENKIVSSLIDIIKNLDKKEPNISPSGNNNTVKIAIYSIVGIAILLFLLFQFNVFGSSSSDNLQLTVFVVDEDGNPALANEGKLNIPLGNRLLNSVIGSDGRTNFGDITDDNMNETIVIGLEAEGWEIVDGNNTFAFDGKPIKLVVRKDESIGIIKGIVKTRNGQQMIQNASISIGADTVISTNEAGVFNAVLPLHMRVSSQSIPYNLTISTPGFKTETQYYYPGQPIEIRLNKN